MALDPLGPGVARDRKHGCGICDGFHPRHFRDYARSVHRLHFQYLRHHRAAVVILLTGWIFREDTILGLRFGRGASVRWSEDVGRGTYPGVELAGVARTPGHRGKISRPDFPWRG